MLYAFVNSVNYIDVVYMEKLLLKLYWLYTWSIKL